MFHLNLESMAVNCFFANILKKNKTTIYIIYVYTKKKCGRCKNQPGQQQFYPFLWGAGELQW